MHIIYLHGFCSSAASFKAQQVKQFIEQQAEHSLYLVDLPYAPAEAMALVESYIANLDDPNWGLIGSSLGGFYASYLGDKYGKKAVLINPAVRPHLLLEAVLGENKNYHSNQTFVFTKQHLTQLKAMYNPRLQHPKDMLLLSQTADEVLDYQQGVEYYQGSEQIVITGGSHAFDGYENFLDKTVDFLMNGAN